MSTIQEQLQQYIAANPTSDLSLVPALVIQTSGKNKLYGEYQKYYVPQTGEVYINSITEINSKFQWTMHGKPLPPNPWANSQKYYYMPYMKFIPELNMLEMAILYMPGQVANKTSVCDKRNWKLWITQLDDRGSSTVVSRMFIPVNSVEAYDSEGNAYPAKYNGKYYNHIAMDFLHHMYCMCKYAYNYFRYGAPQINEFNKWVKACNPDAKPIGYMWYFEGSYQTLCHASLHKN